MSQNFLNKKKNNKLVKFLATASAAAMIASAPIGSAFGGAVSVILKNTELDDTDITNINPVFPNGGKGAGELQFGADTVSIKLNVDKAVIDAVDINGKAGTSMTVTENASLGFVEDSGGTNTATLTFADNKNLVLTATSGITITTDYSGLSKIDFDDKKGSLQIKTNGTSPIDLQHVALVKAGNATLKVDNDTLTTKENFINEIKTITIGENGVSKGHLEVLAKANLKLLDNGQKIQLNKTGSELTINNNTGADINVDITNDWDTNDGTGGKGIRGILNLTDATNKEIKVITANGAGVTVGSNGSGFEEVNIDSQGTVDWAANVKLVAETINVKQGGFFYRNSQGGDHNYSIGDAGGPTDGTLLLVASDDNKNWNLNANGTTTIFKTVTSSLSFVHPNALAQDSTFALHADLDPIKSGIISLDNTSTTNTLTVTGDFTLGHTNNIGSIRATKAGTVILDTDLKVNTNELDVLDGKLIARNPSLVDKTKITIGDAGKTDGNLVLVANVDHPNWDLNANGTTDTTFKTADSILTLEHDAAFTTGNSTFTLQNNLDPGAANQGIVALVGAGADHTLTVQASVAETLGIVGKTLQKISLTSGNAVLHENMAVHADEVEVLDGKLIARNPSLVDKTKITIGDAGPPATNGNLVLVASDTHKVWNLNANGATDTTFKTADSILTLEHDAAFTTGNSTFTLQNNLDPGAANQGIVALVGANKADHTLTVQTQTKAETLGTALNTLQKIRLISGNAVLDENMAIHADEVEVLGGVLTARNNSITDSNITIGSPFLGPLSASTLVLESADALNKNWTLLNTQTIKFNNNAAKLELRGNISGTDSAFTLHNDLLPNADGDNTLILNAADGGQNLTVAANGAKTIGDNVTSFGIVETSGPGTVKIDVPVFTKTLQVTSGNVVELNQAAGQTDSINFTADGTVSLTEANGAYSIFGITTQGGDKGQGTLHIAADKMTLNKHDDGIGNSLPVSLGTAVNPLKSLTFDADHILNVQDKIDIYARNFDSGGLTRGTINLTGAGDRVFAVKMSGGNKLKELNVAGNPTLTIAEDFAADDLIVSTGTNLVFGPNVTTVDVDDISHQDANPGGSITCKNVAPLTIDSRISFATGHFNTLTVAGHNVTMTGGTNILGQNIGVNNIEFNGVNGINLTLNQFDLQNVPVTSNNGENTITLNANQIINQPVGNPNNSVNLVNTDPNSVMSIETTEMYSSIDTLGAVNFNKNGARADAIHAQGNVIFAKNATVAGDVFSNAIVGVDVGVHSSVDGALTANKLDLRGGSRNTYGRDVNITNDIELTDHATASFGGNVTANSIKLLGTGAGVLDFQHNLALNTSVTTEKNNQGVLNFADSVDINRQIGASGKRVNRVSFLANGDDKKMNLANNIHSSIIDFNKQTVSVNRAEIKLDGAVNANNTTFNLNNNKLFTSGGAVTMVGAVVLNTTFNPGNDTVGTATFDVSGFNLVTNNLNTITINVSNRDNTSETGNINLVNVLGSNGGEINENQIKFNVNSVDNKLVKWDYVITDNGKSIEISRTNIAKSVINSGQGDVIQSTPGVAQDIAEKFAKASALSSAGKFRDLEYSHMTSEEGDDAFKRLLTTGVSSANDYALNTTSRVFGDLGQRTLSVDVMPTQVSDNTQSVEGVGAGDDTRRHGLWGSPFYARGAQKQRNSIAGYKSSSYGVIIGIDTMVSDQATLGTAFSYSTSALKHRDFKSGDKTDIRHIMASLYGVYDFGNNWFTRSIASLGSQRIKIQQKRPIPGGLFENSQGKYDIMVGGLQVSTGYNYAIQNAVILTPSVGMSYIRTNNGSLKESGATTQNTSVKSKAVSKMETFTGASLRTMPFMVGELSVTPEMHAYVSYDLRGEKNTVDIEFDGIDGPISSRTLKPSRLSGNVGAGVTAQYGVMEYGIKYDANFASKYTGHQGAVKVRVNF